VDIEDLGWWNRNGIIIGGFQGLRGFLACNLGSQEMLLLLLLSTRALDTGHLVAAIRTGIEKPDIQSTQQDDQSETQDVCTMKREMEFFTGLFADRLERLMEMV